jgi:hypothetical protein
MTATWFVVNEAPVILSQPVSLSVNIGDSASFSVVVNGDFPFTYQWFLNGNAITGANESTYRINWVNSSNLGAYKVTISNAFGSVTSNEAYLNLIPPLLNGLFARRLGGNHRIGFAAFNLGSTRGIGSVTRIVNFCQRHPGPSCNQYLFRPY